MAFDETYNEPESTEVLVKSLDPEHPAQLHYAHACRPHHHRRCDAEAF